MRLPVEMGRKENIIAMICGAALGILYTFIASVLIWGSIIPSHYVSFSGELVRDLEEILLVVFCMQGGLITARFFFQVYLRMRAYRPVKEAGWKQWQEREVREQALEDGGRDALGGKSDSHA